MTGFTREEIIGKHASKLASRDEKTLKKIPEMFASFSEKGFTKNFEFFWLKKDGSSFPIELNATVLKDRKGNITGGISFLRDITERKRSEEVLRESEEKLSGVHNSVTDCMFMLDEQKNIVWSNSVAKQLFGNNIVGKKCYTVFRQNNKVCKTCIVNQCFKNNKSYEHEIEVVNISGGSTDFWGTVSVAARHEDGRPKMVLEVFRDITEKKKLQAEASRAYHLASIGELAAGVAHEINNPINGIINYAQILIDQGNGQNGDTEITHRIIKEGKRIAEIVKNLLSFARDRKDGHSLLHIHEILSDTFGLTKSQLLKDSIRLEVDVPTDLPEIMAQGQQIQQVFLNILSNARYALNQKFPGTNKNKIIKTGLSHFF